MSNKQILWLFHKVEPYLHGTPDPNKYIPELGNLWETIKKKSTNTEEKGRALQMLIMFRNILDAAAREGEKL